MLPCWNRRGEMLQPRRAPALESRTTVEALGMAAAAVRWPSGHGALHEAAANGRTHVCRYLVQDLGFPVDPLSDTGETPLLLAATLGHTATAACLPHAPDHDGEVPLHWAAYNGDLLLAALLLDRGADVGAATPRGTALHIAATQAHPNLVAFLLRHGADPNKLVCRVFTPLVSSILGGSLECMKLLIQMIKLECKRKDELKLEGNKAFEIKDYDAAILLYSMALKLDDTDATLYSNRSICWLRLGDGDEALSDAQACTRVWPDWEKGYYRQGMAFRLLEDYVGACAVFTKALELDPGNPIIIDALRDVSVRAERASSSPC